MGEGTYLDYYLDLYNSVGLRREEIERTIRRIEGEKEGTEVLAALNGEANRLINQAKSFEGFLYLENYADEEVSSMEREVLETMTSSSVVCRKLVEDAELFYKAAKRHTGEGQKEKELADYILQVSADNKAVLGKVFWKLLALHPEYDMEI